MGEEDTITEINDLDKETRADVITNKSISILCLSPCTFHARVEMVRLSIKTCAAKLLFR